LEKVKNSNINIYLTNVRDKTLPQSVVIQNTKENKKVFFSLQQTSLKVIRCESTTEDIYSKYDP
jgi:hypothetical protein